MKYSAIAFLIALFFISCEKQESDLVKMSDKDFYSHFSIRDNSRKGVLEIDSILKSDIKFSKNKYGILHFWKGEHLVSQEKYDAAIVNINKALELFIVGGNQKHIGIANNALGRVYGHLKDYDVAQNYLDKAISIFKEIKDKDNEVVALDGVAYLQFSQKDYKGALESVKQLLAIDLELQDSLSVSAKYNNLGYLSELLDDQKNAEKYYQNAVDIVRIIKSNSISLRNLGSYYLINNRPNKCADLYYEALKVEHNRGDLNVQEEIYNILIDSLGGINKFDKPRLIIKRDSIKKLMVKLESDERIKLLEDQYKLTAKEKELKQVNNIYAKNKIIFSVLAGFFLLLGMFAYQKNKNGKLKLMQEKLVLEQKVLRSQMNPHFIFNALTSIQKNLLEEDLLKSSTSLSRFAKLIRQNFEFTSKELIGLDEDLNALKNYIETQQLRFEDKFDYQINVQKGIDISYIKIPPMLLQPFVENAIEHGLKSKKEKGNLYINVFKNKNLLHFEIIDDGIGFKNKKDVNDREHANDIFFKRLKLRKLGEEKFFSINSLKNGKGTKVAFLLKL